MFGIVLSAKTGSDGIAIAAMDRVADFTQSSTRFAEPKPLRTVFCEDFARFIEALPRRLAENSGRVRFDPSRLSLGDGSVTFSEVHSMVTQPSLASESHRVKLKFLQPLGNLASLFSLSSDPDDESAQNKACIEHMATAVELSGRIRDFVSDCERWNDHLSMAHLQAELHSLEDILRLQIGSRPALSNIPVLAY